MKRFATNPFPEKEIFRHDRDVRFQGSTERLAHARIIRINATSGFILDKAGWRKASMRFLWNQTEDQVTVVF